MYGSDVNAACKHIVMRVGNLNALLLQSLAVVITYPFHLSNEPVYKYAIDMMYAECNKTILRPILQIDYNAVKIVMEYLIRVFNALNGKVASPINPTIDWTTGNITVFGYRYETKETS